LKSTSVGSLTVSDHSLEEWTFFSIMLELM